MYPTLQPLRIIDDRKQEHVSSPIFKKGSDSFHSPRKGPPPKRQMTRRLEYPPFNIMKPLPAEEKVNVDDVIKSKKSDIFNLQNLYQKKGKEGLWMEILRRAVNLNKALTEIFNAPSDIESMLDDILRTQLMLEGMESADPRKRTKILSGHELNGAKCYQKTEDGWAHLSSEEREIYRNMFTKSSAIWWLSTIKS